MVKCGGRANGSVRSWDLNMNELSTIQANGARLNTTKKARPSANRMRRTRL
jgi:hypothetical protein